MAKFDIIDAAGRAYQTSWAERRYLLRLAAVPFFIQLVCMTAGLAFAKDAQYLRFSLIMVPAYLAEGWMLCHYVRLLCRGERWPFQSTGDRTRDLEYIAPRARGVLGGTIVYALIHLAVAALMAATAFYLMPYIPASPAAPAPDVPPAVAFSSLLLFGFVVWGIRVVWLYILFAVNGDPVSYFRKLRGGVTSFYMAALWFLCLMPFVVLLKIAMFVLADPASAMFGVQAGSFIALALSIVADMLKSFVATAGMTFALREIYKKDQEGERKNENRK